MATTNKGIYYPNNYSNVADVPEDMKKLAESVDTQISNLDTNKVDKVDGKGLSTNDYTNEDKAKLDSLENYDDTEITQEIEDIQAKDESQDTEIDKQSDLIQKLKDNCINVTTDEATSLQVQDASTLPAKLDVRGNHSQETREGYNLWDYLNVVNASVGGLTIDKDYENGYITVNGTPNNNYVNLCSSVYIDDLLEDGQTYTLWQEIYADSNTRGVYLQLMEDTPGGGTNHYYSRDGAVTVTIDKEKFLYRIVLQTASVEGTGTLTNYKNRYMLYKGTNTKAYELPGASPSINYPSEVRIVGDNVNIFPINTEYFELAENGIKNKANSVGKTITEINVKKGQSIKVGFKLFSKPSENTTFTCMINDVENSFLNIGRFNNYNLNQKYEFSYIATENVTFKYILNGNSTNEIFEFQLWAQVDELTNYSKYGQGSVEIKKINKNWAEIDTPRTVERSGLSITLDDEDVFTINGTSTANIYINLINIGEYQNTTLTNYKLPLKKYKAYFDLIQKNNSAVSESNGDASFYIRNFAASSTGEQVISYCVFGGLIKGNTGVQIKDCNITDNRIVTYLYVANGVKLDNFKFRFALYNEDETDTTYEKYEESSYILDIQKPMLKGDYFDLERGKEVHKWIERELTGTENITLTDTVNGIAQFTFSQFYDGDYDTGYVNINALSNCYKGVPFQSSWLKDNSIALVGGYTARIMTSEYSTVEEFKQMLAEKYAEGNPVKIYYKLIKPKELGLTEEQKSVLQQLSELPLFKGTNNIITAESLALLQMSYIADTQSYIDSKLNNINQQILELAGGN